MQEKLAANLNMCLVIYTLPAVLEMNKAPANLFSKKILEAWKAHFPKTNLKASTFKQINSGLNGNSVTSPQQCAEHLANRMIVMS